MTNINGISNVKNREIDKIIKNEGLKAAQNENLWEQDFVSDGENMEIDVDISSITGEKPDKKSISKRVKTFFEKIFFKAGGLTRFTGLPVAGELLKLSMISEEKIEKRIEKNGGQILSPEKSKELLAQCGLHEGDNGHTEPEQMKLKTVVFGKNSKITQKTQENEVLQEKVKEWAENGAEENAIVRFNTANSGSFDLRLGFGFSHIIGLHKTDDGYAEGYVEDVYDYDVDYATGKTENAGLLKKAKTQAVKTLDYMAVDLQDEGIIKNYRVLVPIRVKIDTEEQA